MNKLRNVAISLVISTFVAMNLYVLFSEKSIIPKTIYVSDYEKMSSNTYKEVLQKDGLLAPAEIFTVYTAESSTINTWRVKEGDTVNAGDELASLHTDYLDEQRALWETEKEALLVQQNTIRASISDLQYRAQAGTANETDSDRVRVVEDTEVNINVQVDVDQTGSFAHAISEAERDLADVERKLMTVEAQLEKSSIVPALVSPASGVVARIHSEKDRPTVVLYSNEKVIETYAEDEEWNRLKTGDSAVMSVKGADTLVEGKVTSIDQVPARQSEFLQAYKKLVNKTTTNPLAYYKVRLDPNEQTVEAPYGTHINTTIVTDEANNASSVLSNWVTGAGSERAFVWKLNKYGNAVAMEVTVPFDYLDRSIISEGMNEGDVALYNKILRNPDSELRVFFPMPLDFPSKTAWKEFGWKNYMKVFALKKVTMSK